MFAYLQAISRVFARGLTPTEQIERNLTIITGNLCIVVVLELVVLCLTIFRTFHR